MKEEHNLKFENWAGFGLGRREKTRFLTERRIEVYEVGRRIMDKGPMSRPQGT